jgi:hypothetical protein
MRDLRLGDVLDDFCIKCRRLTNHSIVSLLDGKAAKVRCRTCYNAHDFRNEQAPPSKKDLKKAALFNQVLASAGVPVVPDGVPIEAVLASDPGLPLEARLPSDAGLTTAAGLPLESAAAAGMDPPPQAAAPEAKPAAKKTGRKKA